MADQLHNRKNLDAIAPAFKEALAKRHPITEKQMAVFEKAFAERMAEGKKTVEAESKREGEQRKRERKSQTQSGKKSQRQSQ